MTNLQPIFPEVDSSQGTLLVRHDLTNHSVTIYFKDWSYWDVDTDQLQIFSNLIHFIEPDGDIVGIKCLSAGEES